MESLKAHSALAAEPGSEASAMERDPRACLEFSGKEEALAVRL